MSDDLFASQTYYTTPRQQGASGAGYGVRGVQTIDDLQKWVAFHPQRAEALGIVESHEARQKREFKERAEEFRQRAEELKAEYELRTSVEDKRRMSRIQQGYAAAVSSGLFSEDELKDLQRQTIIGIMDLPKTLVPKTAEQKQQDAWAAAGQPIGGQWRDDMGNTYTREPSGRAVMQVPFDKTPEYQARAAKARFDEYISKQRMSLMEKTDTVGRPLYAAERIEEILESDPRYRAQKENQRRAEAEQRRRDAAVPWWQRAHASGLPVQPQDRDLPEPLGIAQVTLRQIREKYNEQKPPRGSDDYAKMLWAARIIQEYEAKRSVPRATKRVPPRL